MPAPGCGGKDADRAGFPLSGLRALWMQPEKAGEIAGASALRACTAATASGYVLGAELRACGVDLSFTPVLDLDHGGSSVIGDRALGRDARVVTLLAQARQLDDEGQVAAAAQRYYRYFPDLPATSPGQFRRLLPVYGNARGICDPDVAH